MVCACAGGRGGKEGLALLTADSEWGGALEGGAGPTELLRPSGKASLPPKPEQEAPCLPPAGVPHPSNTGSSGGLQL